jgi:hypothetical protein
VKLTRAPHRHDRLATLRIRYRPAGAKEFREIARPLLGREVEKKATTPRRRCACPRLWRGSPSCSSRPTGQRARRSTAWRGEAADLEPLPGHEDETIELRDLIERARTAAVAQAASQERQ